jgi:hypothetical protein
MKEDINKDSWYNMTPWNIIQCNMESCNLIDENDCFFNNWHFFFFKINNIIMGIYGRLKTLQKQASDEIFIIINILVFDYNVNKFILIKNCGHHINLQIHKT